MYLDLTEITYDERKGEITDMAFRKRTGNSSATDTSIQTSSAFGRTESQLNQII